MRNFNPSQPSFRLREIAALLVLALCWTSRSLAANSEVIGAGASFPAPVIEAWAAAQAHEQGVTVIYRSVGSGEGIRRVVTRAVDFAMTDAPLTHAELMQDDLLQFPVIAGAIAPVVNIQGVATNALKLTGRVLAEIFLGKISFWNAPAIQVLNPDLALPAVPITVVHRADGSGTSFVFTDYLSKVSPEWQDRLGIGSRLVWPVGVGAKGNDGVAQKVRETAGAIGYVEHAFAMQSRLAEVQLQNKAGKLVQPSDEAVRAALASANWSRASFYDIVTNRDGDASWPIVGVSFALIHKKQDDAQLGAQTVAFFDWIFRQGEPAADRLHYIILTDKGLIARILASFSAIQDDDGRPVWHAE